MLLVIRESSEALLENSWYSTLNLSTDEHTCIRCSKRYRISKTGQCIHKPMIIHCSSTHYYDKERKVLKGEIIVYYKPNIWEKEIEINFLYKLYKLYNNTLILICSLGLDLQVCVRCHDSCRSCRGDGEYDCLSCPADGYKSLSVNADYKSLSLRCMECCYLTSVAYNQVCCDCTNRRVTFFSGELHK